MMRSCSVLSALSSVAVGLGVLATGACTFSPGEPVSYHCTAAHPGCPDGYECAAALQTCVKKGASVEAGPSAEAGADLRRLEIGLDLPSQVDATGDGRPDAAADLPKKIDAKPAVDLPRVEGPKPDQLKCGPGLCLSGTTCVGSRSVQCDPNNSNPPHSNDTIANVTVTCQSNGTFSAPAACGWHCVSSYCLESGACLASKVVTCDINNGNPANSSDTLAGVTVTCQANGSFTAPAPCAWTCKTGYYRNKAGTACVRPMYLVSAGAAQGSAGGARATQNARCVDAVSASYSSLGTSRTVAFISISTGDALADLPSSASVPTGRPVFGPTGVRIADDWADLLDGSISNSLSDAGVTNGYWFSGSTSSGTLSANTCTSWTAINVNDGTYGSPVLMNSSWISAGGSGYCGGSYHYLCLTWTP